MGACMQSWYAYKLGECMALWGEPNEPSIQHHAGLHLYDIAS